MPVKTLLKKPISFSLRSFLCFFKYKSFLLLLVVLCFATVKVALLLKSSLTPDVLAVQVFETAFTKKQTKEL